MEFQDKVLKCADCGSDFIFTAGEQLFFHDKQFKNEPKRCRECKTKRASMVGAGSRTISIRVETHAVCSHCGKETTVPFKPTQGRPIFCRECFQLRQAAEGRTRHSQTRRWSGQVCRRDGLSPTRANRFAKEFRSQKIRAPFMPCIVQFMDFLGAPGRTCVNFDRGAVGKCLPVPFAERQSPSYSPRPTYKSCRVHYNAEVTDAVRIGILGDFNKESRSQTLPSS